MNFCLKYHKHIDKTVDCQQLKEDGHCLYCPCLQTSPQIVPALDETVIKVLESFIDTAKKAIQ